VLYPLGAHDPFLSHFGPSNLVLPLKFDITICDTSRLGIYVLLSPNLLEVQFPSHKAILEGMIMDPQPLPEQEALLVGYQISP
jgi:hypothetical protein